METITHPALVQLAAGAVCVVVVGQPGSRTLLVR
jgi:hypothetical protein